MPNRIHRNYTIHGLSCQANFEKILYKMSFWIDEEVRQSLGDWKNGSADKWKDGVASPVENELFPRWLILAEAQEESSFHWT